MEERILNLGQAEEEKSAVLGTDRGKGWHTGEL